MLLALMQGVTTFVREEAGAGCTVPDQSSEFVAFWDFEEASNSTRVASGGSCSSGSDCDLANQNTMLLDAVNFVEQSGSAASLDADNDALTCANATCDELTGLTGSVTWGVYAMTPTLQNQDVFDNLDGSNGGFEMKWRTNVFECRIGDGVDTATATSAGSSLSSDSTFYHLACVHDDVGNTIQAYVDGAASGSSASQDDMAANAADTFQVSQTGSLGFDGSIDAPWVYSGVLSAAEVCYLCSAGGPANDAGMTCSGGSFVGLGLNASQCGSCSLAGLDPEDPITP